MGHWHINTKFLFLSFNKNNTAKCTLYFMSVYFVFLKKNLLAVKLRMVPNTEKKKKKKTILTHVYLNKCYFLTCETKFLYTTLFYKSWQAISWLHLNCVNFLACAHEEDIGIAKNFRLPVFYGLTWFDYFSKSLCVFVGAIT